MPEWKEFEGCGSHMVTLGLVPKLCLAWGYDNTLFTWDSGNRSMFSFLLNRSAPRTGHPGPYGAARLAGLGTVIVYWDATERARGSPPPQAPVRD